MGRSLENLPMGTCARCRKRMRVVPCLLESGMVLLCIKPGRRGRRSCSALHGRVSARRGSTPADLGELNRQTWIDAPWPARVRLSRKARRTIRSYRRGWEILDELRRMKGGTFAEAPSETLRDMVRCWEEHVTRCIRFLERQVGPAWHRALLAEEIEERRFKGERPGFMSFEHMKLGAEEDEHAER